VVGDDALSYAQLRDASCRFAAALAGLTHCTGGGISGYDHAVCTIHVLTAT
jgi:hypothetical protein